MPFKTSTGLHDMYQWMLTLAFALALSFLGFAASFAEVPRSEFVPSQTLQH